MNHWHNGQSDPLYQWFCHFQGCWLRIIMRKNYDDDDGRTVADMSGVDNNSVLSGLFTGLNTSRHKKEKNKKDKLLRATENIDQTESEQEKKTRRLYAFGAMRAGLLIGAVYLAAFAALIILLLLIWGKL